MEEFFFWTTLACSPLTFPFFFPLFFLFFLPLFCFCFDSICFLLCFEKMK